MTALVWDAVGNRTFYAGLDRGVLYLPEGGYAWNGLTGVTDGTPTSIQPYYQDGQKYLNHQVLGEYEGTLKAFTYPSAFDACQGSISAGAGLYVHDQPANSFGLSYRTKLGDDVQGLDRGYILHLLYNLTAQVEGRTHTTIGETAAPEELSWKLSSIPIPVNARRSTSHFTIKSTETLPGKLTALENALYGTATTASALPSLDAVIGYLNN